MGTPVCFQESLCLNSVQENNETKLIAAEVYEMIGNNTNFNGSETTETKWSMDAGKIQILVPHQEMKRARQPIRSGVILNSRDNGH